VSSAEKSGEAAVGPQPVPEKIRPLSGKPYFSCIMCKSHVHPPFQVVLYLLVNHILYFFSLKLTTGGYRNCKFLEPNCWMEPQLCFTERHFLCLGQVVPRSLAPFLPSTTAPATLTWCGRSWDMRFTGGRQIQRLEAGWRGFALDSSLRLGDGCVFELVDGATEGGTIRFSMQVLRAHVPSAIRERAGEYNSSSPIEIE
jgi:hypothetical protein